MSSPAEPPTSLRLRCSACGQTYRIKNGSRQKKYLCQKCKVPLKSQDETDEQTFLQIIPAEAADAPTINSNPNANAGANIPVDPDSLHLKGDVRFKPVLQDDLELELFGQSRSKPSDLKKLMPDSFHGYRVIKELARGGMGAVLLAEQSELRRSVAMKIMLPWAAEQDPGSTERFMREGRSMAKLKHPHIIEVYSVGSINDVSYLTMEFIAGETLGTLFDQKRLGFEQVAVIMSKVARALAFAHARGVIHRDIKPANIMLRDNGEPVLMDFGLAKDFDANTMKLSMTGNIMGTPSYMSPEQAQGQRVNERSDVYSLGAVLYEALTRQTPFSGDTTIATIYNVVHNDLRPAIEIDKSVPAGLSRICSKALEKDPARRYLNMDELAGDLDRYREGMEVSARGPSAGVKTLDWARKNTAAVSGIIVAIAAGFLVAVGIQMGWLRPGKSKADELRAALTSGSVKSRLVHAQALAVDLHDGLILPGSVQAEDALAALRLAAADPDGDVAASAVTALGEADDKKAEQVLKDQLDAKRPLNVRRAAPAALSRINPQGLSTILLRTIKADPSQEVKLAAVEAMHDVMGPDIMISLLEIAAHGEPALAAACNKKLSQLRPPENVMSFYTGGNGAIAGKAMSQMLEQKRQFENQTEQLLNDLDNSEKPKARKAEPFEIASKVLQTGERAARMSAAYDLGALGDNRAEQVLEDALKDEDRDIALTCAAALGKLPALKNTELIGGFLKLPSPVTRQAAARAYGLARPTPPGQPLCDALLSEKQGAVQAEIAQALGNMKYPGAVAPLSALLAQGSPEACRRAAWALGRIGDKSACAALLDALGKAGKDNELKEDIAGALSALTGETLGPDEAKWREVIKALK